MRGPSYNVRLTDKQKEKLYNQEDPLLSRVNKYSFEELLAENPEIYNKHYRHTISPRSLNKIIREVERNRYGRVQDFLKDV
jgi:hypothetical protein